MFEIEYQYFQKRFSELPRFRANGQLYQPFVSTDNKRWGLGFPDIFYHISSASKVTDCNNSSPIFPCCNTTALGSCSGLPIKQYAEKTGRIPCPYRAGALHCVLDILLGLASGKRDGVQMAILPYYKGRITVFIRKRVGPLDYLLVFKKFKQQEDDKGRFTPLLLITCYPLAYRNMIRIVEGQLKKHRVPLGK